jgi:hypothetical protein
VRALHAKGAGLLLGTDAYKRNVMPAFLYLKSWGILSKLDIGPDTYWRWRKPKLYLEMCEFGAPHARAVERHQQRSSKQCPSCVDQT